MSGLIGITPAKTADAPGGDANAVVSDVAQSDFAGAVIEASMQKPVIVDFWADWCGPCKTLMPLLEKVVLEAKGAVLLAKVDTEKNQELAAQLRIQSLPTVYAFWQGRPLDGFQGALPESEIRAFVDKVIAETGATADGDDDFQAALELGYEQLDQGNAEQAEAIAGQLMQVAGDKPEVAILLCKALLGQGRDEDLEGLFTQLDPAIMDSAEMKVFRAGLALRKDGEGLGSIEELRAAATTPEGKFDLSRKLLATGAREEAADILLDIFKTDRDWNDGAARAKLLEMFEVYGNADPFTLATRRRFSAVHYS